MSFELVPESEKHAPSDAASGNQVQIDRELIKRIAKDVGEALQLHIQTMYPAAVDATASTFLLSVRNSIINEIMAAVAVSDVDRIETRLKERKAYRRKIRAMLSKFRDKDAEPTD